jgi:hypothetical protein
MLFLLAALAFDPTCIDIWKHMGRVVAQEAALIKRHQLSKLRG